VNTRASTQWTPLEYAVDRNREEMRDFLRSCGAKGRRELDEQTDPTAGEFQIAVQKGDLAGATRALARDPGLVNRTGKHPVWGGRPQALHLAIVRGNLAMFDLLL